jgi:hypothetical protein
MGSCSGKDVLKPNKIKGDVMNKLDLKRFYRARSPPGYVLLRSKIKLKEML